MKLSRISTGGDNKFAGDEPTWTNQSDISNIKSAEIGALNWYNYFCDRKQSRTFLVEYLRGIARPKAEVDSVSKVNENSFPIQLGFIARMMSQGYQPSENFKNFFQKEYKKVLMLVQKTKAVVEVEPTQTVVVNIQDRIREKASEEIGEVEGLVDDFVMSGCKTKVDFESYFKSRNLSSVVSKRICEHFILRSKEFEEVISTDDPDLKEGYSNFSKVNLRKMKEYMDSIVAESNRLVEANKPVRKKRKVKEKPLAVQVAKVSYLKEFAELNLLSVAPEKIIGAMQVWTYNTKTKLLGMYNADNAKGFSIKGTTIQNYNEQTSIGKRLRKPQVTTKEVLDAGKIKLRKIMDTLTTKESGLTGRLNSDTIILRVVKE